MSPYLQRLASGWFFFSSRFCSNRSFPAGREESSRVWCGFTVIVVRVVFTLLCMETLVFSFFSHSLRLLLLASWKMLWQIYIFSWLFVQLNVERIHFVFVFFAQSHSSVAPHPPSLPLLQVWPWLRSRSVRFTRNKLFFFLQTDFSLLGVINLTCLQRYNQLDSFDAFQFASARSLDV